jgi:hypothetical protein
MKDVTIYSSASCDCATREGSFFAALEYQGHFKYLTGRQSDTTVDRCILMGLLQAIHLISVPCRLTLVTATQLAFNRLGDPKGQNRDLKQLLLRLGREKKCELQFELWPGGGERLKLKLAEIEQVAAHVAPIDVIAHYRTEERQTPELF